MDSTSAELVALITLSWKVPQRPWASDTLRLCYPSSPAIRISAHCSIPQSSLLLEDQNAGLECAGGLYSFEWKSNLVCCLKVTITHSPLLVVRLMLSSQMSCGLCLPEEQRRMAGTLEDAKGRNLLPALGSAEVTGFVGRGRRPPLPRTLISFLSTSSLSCVM